MVNHFLSLQGISAKGILKHCGINPQKYYDVKRGKSSFSFEEIDLILEQIHTLKEFPVIPKEPFLNLLNNDKRIVLKHVLFSLSKSEYQRFQEDLRNGATITDKRFLQIIDAFTKWQGTLPDSKKWVIEKALENIGRPITNFADFIEGEFSEREVSFYQITELDIIHILNTKT